MTDLHCPNCEGTEIRIEVPGYYSYRPVRIEPLPGGGRMLIAELYDSGESDTAGDVYCVDCGAHDIDTGDLLITGWQDTERWNWQQARAKQAG